MVLLSNFNLFVYVLYLSQRKEMEMAWLANASEHFDKLQAGRSAMVWIVVFAVVLLYHKHLYMCKELTAILVLNMQQIWTN